MGPEVGWSHSGDRVRHRIFAIKAINEHLIVTIGGRAEQPIQCDDQIRETVFGNDRLSVQDDVADAGACADSAARGFKEKSTDTLDPVVGSASRGTADVAPAPLTPAADWAVDGAGTAVAPSLLDADSAAAMALASPTTV